MAKRKRNQEEDVSDKIAKSLKLGDNQSTVYVQIITGSYERTLHGITAAIPKSLLATTTDSEESEPTISFADTFLFNAHTSAVRCLALSPIPSADSKTQKVVLATGSTDEKINLYHISTTPPQGPVLPSLKSKTIHDPKNRTLGVLHTHDATVTALHFPAKSKLISACSKNIIAITSTRDWNTLSLIKAPTPKHLNRPTGDTSTASTLPAGINDFAVHPSMKLMLSVGRAERCMRLWNLVTGKRAGVLNFSKEMLKEVGENTHRWGSGEGRRVLWNKAGDEFAVAFEWGVCIFGDDCKPKVTILSEKKTRIHQSHYVPGLDRDILAISTEDGRILFYSTTPVSETNGASKGENTIPSATYIGQLGGPELGIAGRIKDFVILERPGDSSQSLIVVTVGSGGVIRLWVVEKEEINSDGVNKQLGRLLGMYETGSRVTCMKAFVMLGNSGENEIEQLNGHQPAKSASEPSSVNEEEEA